MLALWFVHVFIYTQSKKGAGDLTENTIILIKHIIQNRWIHTGSQRQQPRCLTAKLRYNYYKIGSETSHIITRLARRQHTRHSFGDHQNQTVDNQSVDY